MVHTDDTGWRVGGESACLMAFETDAATVYQVRPRHRHEEVQEVIPADYVGVMVTDRGRSYDCAEPSTAVEPAEVPGARPAVAQRGAGGRRRAERATSGRG